MGGIHHHARKCKLDEVKPPAGLGWDEMRDHKGSDPHCPGRRFELETSQPLPLPSSAKEISLLPNTNRVQH